MLSSPRTTALSSLRRQRPDTIITLVAIIVGVVLAAYSDATPTGISSWDVVLRVSFVGALTLAAVRGPAWASFPANAAVVLLGGPLLFLLIAVAAMVAVPIMVLSRSDVVVIRAVTASSGSAALLHLTPAWFFGFPSCVAALAAAAVVFAALRAMSTDTRRKVNLACLATGGLTLIVLLIAVVSLASVRGATDRSAVALRSARQTIAAGDENEARAILEQAAIDLHEVASATSSWRLAPARLVPVVSQHLRLARDTSSGGLRSVKAARDALAVVDETRFRRSGAFDIAAIRRAAQSIEEVRDAVAALADDLVSTESGWLLPAASERVAALKSEIETALPLLDQAVEATAALPDLLGADRPVRYLILIQTPAEARELGGIVANWLELSIDSGVVAVTRRGRNSDLVDLDGSALESLDSLPQQYLLARPELFAQNYTATPDFPTVALTARAIYEEVTGSRIDGVITLDPFALRAFLDLTGPIAVAGLDEPVTAEAALDFFFVEQYAEFAIAPERIDMLGDLAAAAFERINDIEPPAARTIFDMVKPLVDQERMRVWVFDPDLQPVLDTLGLARPFGRSGADDFLAVVHSNGAATKLDTFLDRHIEYRARVDATSGHLTSTAVVTLANRATPDLPGYVLGEPGTTTIEELLSVYSPHRLTSAMVDGVAVEVAHQFEYGISRYLIWAVVTPERPVVVEFSFEGTIEVADQMYELMIDNQPLVTADDVSVSLTVVNGTWRPSQDLVVDEAHASISFEQTQDWSAAVGFIVDG